MRKVLHVDALGHDIVPVGTSPAVAADAVDGACSLVSPYSGRFEMRVTLLAMIAAGAMGILDASTGSAMPVDSAAIAAAISGTSPVIKASEYGAPVPLNLDDSLAPRWCANACREHGWRYTGRWIDQRSLGDRESICVCKSHEWQGARPVARKKLN